VKIVPSIIDSKFIIQSVQKCTPFIRILSRNQTKTFFPDTLYNV